MGIRRAIVEIDPSTINVTAFCREHGISTWFFYEQRRRYREHGEAGLRARSRAPHRVANKTLPEVEGLIIAARKELFERSGQAGAETIAAELRGAAGLPSASTIHRILRRRGFIVPAPAKAPKRAWKRFAATRANETWQLDDTTWVLTDGTETKILNVLDDHSRLLVASRAWPTVTGARALRTVADAAAELGWPARFLSDNATAFRFTLAEALRPLGVAAGHGRPYHPQTTGKVERLHQTLKRWLARQPRAASLAELQAQLDRFRNYYNTARPHRALDRRTPAQTWAAAPKALPGTGITAPTRVHRGTVSDKGYAPAGDRLIQVGARHTGRPVTTIITGTKAHVFADGQLIRALDIHPTARVQPFKPKTVRDVPPHP